MRSLVSMALLPAALCVALLGFPELVHAQSRLDTEAMLGLKRVGDLALSPDGAHLLYTVKTTDLGQNRTHSVVYLLATDPAAKAREVAVGTAPLWLDADRYAYFVGGSMVTLSLTTDLMLRETLPALTSNVKAAPQGGGLAATRAVPLDPPVTASHRDLPHAVARAYDDLMVRHWDAWTDGSYSHLFVRFSQRDPAELDLLAGERVHTPLPPFGGSEQFAWSPDGKELCYTARRVADPESSTDSALWVVPVTGGTHRCLTEGMPGYDQDPVYSPDGRYIAFSSMQRAGFEADRARLFLHDRNSTTNRELLPDFDASPHNVVWSSDSSTLYFTVEVAGTTQVFRTAVADPKPACLTSGRQAFSGLQVDPAGQWLYALRTTMERPAEVVRIATADGSWQALTDANGAYFAQLQLPEITAERFTSSDGEPVHAWILKPPGFDSQQRYPLVLYCQGGPQSMVGQSFSFRWNFHLMAAKGYVVAAVNRRGLPGFGQAWNDQISRDWGGQAMQDLLAVTDAMRERPYIDPARCAAVGASFGGYSVYWLMGNSGDRFACMISHCGVFNLESMYLATEELFFVNHDLGGPYWASEEIAADYRRFSPHRYVQNWHTPLLVIHGEKDFRVPYDQGLQAFTAAQLRHVPSRLLVFPEEGHWVLSAQNAVLWQREFFGWLDRYCGKPAK